MELHEDLLEASSSRYHRDVAKQQMKMFEDLGVVRRHLVEIANGQLLQDGMPARPKIVEAARDALNQTWEQIRADAYRVIAKLREEKEARDQKIRGYVPSA